MTEIKGDKMNAGRIYELKVLRKTDLGYMLGSEEDDVLLHFKESDKEYKTGDIAKVFIYYDKKGRPCATCNTPFVTVDNPGFVNVVEVISNLGVFVNNNTGKDLLISKDNLPYDKKIWPVVDDKLLVELKVKSDTILAKPLNRYEIDDLRSEAKYELGSYVEAYIYRIGDAGINMVTMDMVNVFVHKSMYRDNYRIGQMAVVKIIHEASSGYNGSLIEQKEKVIDSDKEILLRYLDANGGKMKLDAKSSSEEIEGKLHLSRKAFKRALGGLYKDRIVDFKDGYTIKIK